MWGTFPLCCLQGQLICLTMLWDPVGKQSKRHPASRSIEWLWAHFHVFPDITSDSQSCRHHAFLRWPSQCRSKILPPLLPHSIPWDGNPRPWPLRWNKDVHMFQTLARNSSVTTAALVSVKIHLSIMFKLPTCCAPLWGNNNNNNNNNNNSNNNERRQSSVSCWCYWNSWQGVGNQVSSKGKVNQQRQLKYSVWSQPHPALASDTPILGGNLLTLARMPAVRQVASNHTRASPTPARLHLNSGTNSRGLMM